ncbi:MAG: FkbM family methyltransferase [Actinomycetota bacterium]|nr:FkbM family methyltransferase [Actinomycetota bacterium]
MVEDRQHERSSASVAAAAAGLAVVQVRSDVGRYELAVPPDDHLADVIRRTGRPYEERLLRFLVALQGPSSGTVVDVGANIGNHTVFFARRGERVIAVEANPGALAYLERNVERYDDVVIWPVAAGASPGRGHVAAGSTGQLGQSRFEVDPAGPIEVVTLDSIDEPVSILKVDVEGGEEAVLEGARQLIRRSRPVVVVESWDVDHRRAIVRLLRPLGYRRFPLSLCATPTYVYVPSWPLLVRAWRTAKVPSRLVSLVLRIVGARCSGPAECRRVRRSTASAPGPPSPTGRSRDRR